MITTTPLPAAKDGKADAVHFALRDGSLPKAPNPDLAALPHIVVTAQLNKPHLLVAELKAPAKAVLEDKGVLPLNYRKVLRVRTSASQLKRALILVYTLIKQFEKRRL